MDVLNCMTAAARPSSDSTLYLVQLNKGSNNIVHTMIQHDQIDNNTDQKMINQGLISVRDGNTSKPATVLFKSKRVDLVEDELQRLKTYCYNLAFYESKHKQKYQNNDWLLVQYSCGPKNTVYAVINCSETVLKNVNCYPDVVTYLSDGSHYYQAIILRKSQSRKELYFELENLKEACLRSRQFKLEYNIPY